MKITHNGLVLTSRMEEQERRLMSDPIEENRMEEKTKVLCPVVDLNAGLRGPANIIQIEHETKYGQLLPTGPGSQSPSAMEKPPACHICK